ncbi:Holliday junction resolvase RuvX [Zavarzinia compransoris]|uniref:Putative pre-16S rRNA nuclease n=1 Tax=Zavarzinia compransoris TaxID=1264899 RepID=A0A317EAW1_9PROT|nr:Holliday junction resolvase RuvX [Zavarzinia compransoris]PWR23290.1 Holliday junction resolvase RuvX [Zavarzinia compransoris]TDP46141.1 putative Holliday junction resolvase [Zavarzinia compransoris]
MPQFDHSGFDAVLPPQGRLLGVDLGTKTIGLALSDISRTVASPLETIRRVKFSIDVQRFFALIDEHAVAGVVLGLPMNMDGTAGPRVQATRAFASEVLKRRDLALSFWDERLSTAAVTRMMIDADMTRARRAELVDKLAATYILQGFLDGAATRRRACGGQGGDV